MTAQTPPLAGSYRCVVVDPPWNQRKTGIRSVRPKQGRDLDYPTMTLDEIEEVAVPEWAAEDAFPWIWTTNGRSRSSGLPTVSKLGQRPPRDHRQLPG